MNATPAFLILADKSASWRIAGLSQLDRLVLALNEFVEFRSADEVISVVVFWHPEVPSGTRWLPRHPRITRIRLTEAIRSVPEGARVLHTGLFVERNGLAVFLEEMPAIAITSSLTEVSASWSELEASFVNGVADHSSNKLWRFVRSPADSAECEQNLLKHSGKSQDGIISRFVNRPVSRRLSQFLLRYDLTPTAWTLYTFVLPVGGFLCLARGDYFGIVGGAILFQLYSIVDGCDGEIARATYQESERGGRIDDFLDMLGSFLFVLGLGLGLFRSRSSIYLLEGIICGTMIAVNEWSLRRVNSADKPRSDKITASLYPRHRRLLANGILARRNERFLWWIVQFTKRDVAIFVFLVLALLDRAQWILHLWLAVSAGILLLSARSSAGQNSSAAGSTL